MQTITRLNTLFNFNVETISTITTKLAISTLITAWWTKITSTAIAIKVKATHAGRTSIGITTSRAILNAKRTKVERIQEGSLTALCTCIRIIANITAINTIITRALSS